MANPAIKPIKVLSDIALKQDAKAKQGLTISGSIQNSGIGLHVDECAIFNKDVAINGIACAEGFTQVGAIDILGLLTVDGHLVTTGSFELSGSKDFSGINILRDQIGLYNVDDAIQALDERSYIFSTTFNSNKERFDSKPTVDGTKEHISNFPWNVAGYISLDIMVYNPTDDSWSNDLISVKMIKNIVDLTDDNEPTVKFIVTTPKLGDPGVHPDTIIRVIATRQTDIL